LLSQYIYLQALFLPEASDYIASSPAETVSLVRSVEDSPFVRGIQEEAKAYGLAVNVGIHEPTISGKKVKNTSIWINENGEITQRYQKIHLFDVEIKNGPVLKESNSVEKGTSILPPFNTSLGRVGLTICFDVRAIIPKCIFPCQAAYVEIDTFPRDKLGAEASECSDHHLSISVHSTNWPSALGNTAESEGD
jgi:predicted amidohydrolase